jgi:ribosomal protein S18 acetylase RimI-like enzyme
MVELAELSGATAEGDERLAGLLVRRAGRGPAFNYLAAIRWPDADWSALQAAIEQRFHELGEWPCLLVAEGLTGPARLAATLESRGWLSLERETILWTRQAAIVPHLDPGLRIEAVTTRSAATHERLEREVFELAATSADERVELLLRAIHAGRLRAYLVRLHGEPVAVARLTARDGVAALYGIGVAEEARRQGLGRLITIVATRAALATGNGLVWLSVDQTNIAARQLYASLGLRPAFEWVRLLGPAE